MPTSDQRESPLETVARVGSDTVGPSVIDAFDLLGNETRLAILLALWDAYDPLAPSNELTFTALRTRVGVRQGAQFNYHLEKLLGTFVRKTDEGYELRSTGLALVQSIIAGTGFADATFEETEIDATCDLCGSRTAITYQDGRVYQVCTTCPGEASPGDGFPDGALIAWTFDPTGLTDRTAEELLAASTVKNFARIALRFEGICPDCSGPIDWSLDVCADHHQGDGVCDHCGRTGPVLARETCSVCKSTGWGTPAIKVLFHPAVISFYHDHGVDLGFTGDTDYTDVVRTLRLVDDFEVTVETTEPLQIRVSMVAGDDERHLILDDELTVVDVQDGR